MRLNLDGAPDCYKFRQPEIGDVYITTKGTFMLVTEVTSHGARYIGFDNRGQMKNCGGYAMHWFEERRRIGTAEIPDLHINVDWESLPPVSRSGVS